MRFSYYHLKFLLQFVCLTFYCYSIQAQISGSVENGTTLPKQAEKFNIATGAHQGNVNLFSGVYNSSYSLGTVSVPNGLSYTLNSSYSTSYIGGTHGGILEGIPYGDGRSLSLPTLSVQNESYIDNPDDTMNSYYSTCNGTGTPPALRFTTNDGTVYWHAPYVSIPGVLSGRAIYKHYDDENQRHVFVLNAFERYAEIYLKSNRWTVKLDNGVEYAFNLAVESYRRANHRRSFDYNDQRIEDGPDSSATVKSILKAQITPKAEFLKWYCTEIIDKSKPAAPRIKFDYETFGEFNYFKELSQNHQSAFDQILREHIYNVTSYLYDTNGNVTATLNNIEPNVQDYTVFKDVLLTQVSAHTFYGIEEWLDLEYETQDDHITNSLVMKIEDAGVLRLDSLYSYKSVFYQGEHTNSSQVYNPVKDVTSTVNFSGWNRFIHAAHPDYSSSSGYVPISSTNPYIQNISTRTNRYSYKTLGAANSISMDHGFLSGTITATNMLETRVPGDNYEVRFVVSKDDAMTGANQGGFLNLDISIGGGVVPPGSVSNSVGFDIPAIDFDRIQKTKIFSTFDRMVKWNVRGNTSLNATSSDGLIVTSNHFTMPLFNPNDKLNFQIGPANSDHNFMALPSETTKSGSNTLADAKKAFLHERASWSTALPEQCDFKSIPYNFGVGLPWYQMHHVYEEFNTASLDDMYEFWWHDNPNSLTYSNKPTLAGSNTELEAIELIRYAKNPYMLRHVKKYVVSGVHAVNDSGMVGDQALVRDVELDYTSQNMNMKLSIDDNSGNFKKTFILLKSIRENPVYPANNSLQSGITTADIEAAPTTRFEYGTGVSIGDTTTEHCTGPRCFFQFYFVPLSKEISHLGGETEIEYHAIDTTFSTKSSLVYLGTAQKDRQYTMQFNYQVKKLKKQIGDTTQAVWEYTYSGLDTKYGLRRMVLDTFFTNNNYKADMGAGYTIVSEPEVNGVRNSTKYYHYTNEYEGLLFGKLYKIEKYNPHGTLFEKTEIEYDTLLAFRNGFYKKDRYGKVYYFIPKLDTAGNPVVVNGDTLMEQHYSWNYMNDTNLAIAYHPYFWKYPYLDHLISPQAAFYRNQGAGDIISASDVRLQPLHYTAYAPKYYEGHYVKDDDPAYWDSWFIKKIKETTTEYDTNACVIDDSYYYNSNIDVSVDPMDAIFLNNLKTLGSGNAVENDLIDNSPLSDTVLLEILDTAFLLGDAQLITVFGEQDNVKDTIIKNLINRLPELAEQTLVDIMLGQEKDYSHEVLTTLIDRESQDAYAAVREIMIHQDSLYDSTIFHLLVDTLIPDSVSMLILASRWELSDTVYQWLNDSVTRFGTDFLKNIVLAKRIFPDDNVLAMLAQNTNLSDNDIEDLFTACPYSYSSAVQTHLDGRSPALPSSVSSTISLAQSNIPSYSTYLLNVGITGSVAPFINLTSGNDLESLFQTLTDANTADLDLETEFTAASPLEDTLLLEMIDYAGNYENSTIITILNDQPGLSDTVWTKAINSSELTNDDLLELFNNNIVGFTDDVLVEILLLSPALDNTELQNLLLKQPSISESVFDEIYASELENSNIEPLHFKQRNFTSAGLNAMLDDSREFSESNLTGVLLAQHNFPEKAVLLNLFDHTPAFSNSMIITILSNTTRELSAEVLSEVNTYLPGNYSSLLGVSNKFKLVGKASKLKLYCSNPKLSQTLSISTVKEFEYYDANYKGLSTSEGYRRLLNADVTPLQLLFEPSWQLYRTTAYSPELPGAKTEEEYFYYYDLQQRYENLYWKSGITVDDSLPNNTGAQLTVSSKILGNDIDGLDKSLEYGVKNIAFEKRLTTRYASDQGALARSTYYLHDTVWTLLYEPEDSVIHFTGDTCVTASGDSLATIGCKRLIVRYWGSRRDMAWNMIAFYKPGNPESIFYECPCDAKDTMVNHLGFIAAWANPSAYMTWCDSGVFDTPDTNGPEQVLLAEYSKGKYLQLRSVQHQADTILKGSYADLDITSTAYSRIYYPILGFNEDGEEVFPFDTLEVLHVNDRNEYGQVKQEQNAAGLQTDYFYHKKLDMYYMDTNCYKNNYNGFYNGISGLPYKVKVGSLETLFEYYNDKSLKTITGPNGMTLTQDFDRYGRLNLTKRNSNLLSKYNYNTWGGDTSQAFSTRAGENYSDVITLNKMGSSYGEQNRTFLDPMGKMYQNVQAVTSNTSNFYGVTAPYTHSGEVVYDALGRAIKTYRPFDYSWFGGPKMNAAAGGSVDKTNHQAFAYEDGGFQRLLHEAKSGENIDTGHTVDYEYQLVNYLCMFCDLDLTTANGSIMLPDTGYNYVFRKITVTDEDGNLSTEYQNALGQKIATKGKINNNWDAVTLFVYDAYGNLNKTINPNGQHNDYYYNILGWMYKQVSPDGDEKKMMYNNMGQVVAEMDEEDVLGWYDGTSKYYNTIRLYEYDLHGRLIRQSRRTIPHLYGRVNTSSEIKFNPLLYNNYNITSGEYIYKFSNASTYLWRAEIDAYYDTGVNQGGGGTWTTGKHNIFNYYLYDPQPNYLEKTWHYNSTTYNRIGRLYRTESYDHIEDFNTNNSKLIHATEFKYNADGQISELNKHFLPNDTLGGRKGLHVLIEYPEYDLRGNPLTVNVDVNKDSILDIQYHYTYDHYGRMDQVYGNFSNSKDQGNLLAEYFYNNPTGMVKQVVYSKNCESFTQSVGYTGLPVDTIEYAYDIRNRLTDITSHFYDEALYYDGNNPSKTSGSMGSNNYNGNINGATNTYRLTNAGSLFDDPSKYGYTYDGLNRLITADAFCSHWNSIATGKDDVVGDVKYKYDRVGNFVWLRRDVEQGGSHVQHWYDFTYQGNTTTNKLLGVSAHAGNTTTAARTYSYDAIGNQITDNSRSIIGTTYGRSNLPFETTVDTTEIAYFYDANDARVFKRSKNQGNPGVVINKELYLRDAGGRELGVLDVNAGQWTWYVFGLDRFARLKPKASQQPKTYTGNGGSTGSGVVDWLSYNSTLDNFLIYTWQEGDPLLFGHDDNNYPLQIDQANVNGQIRLFLGSQLQDHITNNPEDEVELLHSSYANSGQQQYSFMDTLGRVYDLPVIELALDPNEPGADTTNQFMESMAASPPQGQRFAYHSDTTLGELVYYVYDHLGNTRVTYTPKVEDCGPPSFDTTLVYAGDSCWSDTTWDGTVYVSHRDSCDSLFANILTNTSRTLSYTLESALDYYPYGKVLREYVATEEKYLTTYNERDKETGLDFRNQRLSDADIPRFGQIDPMDGLYPEWSPYNYTLNNPVRYTDPEGDCPTCLIGGVIGASFALYELSQGEGGFSGAINALADGDGKAWAKVGVGAGTGFLLGSGVGILGSAAIAGTGNLVDQAIQKDGIQNVDPLEVGTATVLGGAGSFGGKLVSGKMLASKTGPATGINYFVEKKIIPTNNTINVFSTETSVSIGGGIVEKVISEVVSAVSNNGGTSQSQSQSQTGSGSNVPLRPQENDQEQKVVPDLYPYLQSN